jgi:hypothetical protein
MANPINVLDGFDKKDQAARVAGMMLPGENLFLVFDCKGRGSGFVGVSDRRVIVRDDGHRKKSLVSIPLQHIHAVGVDSQKGWVRGGSLLTLAAGDDEWELNFNGADKAQRAYQRIMEGVLGIARDAASNPTAIAPE